MSELVKFFGDAVDEEVCTCDPEICRRECDLSRSCSECGDSGHDIVH